MRTTTTIIRRAAASLAVAAAMFPFLTLILVMHISRWLHARHQITSTDQTGQRAQSFSVHGSVMAMPLAAVMLTATSVCAQPLIVYSAGCIGPCSHVSCCGKTITVNENGVGFGREFDCTQFFKSAEASERRTFCAILRNQDALCPDIQVHCRAGDGWFANGWSWITRSAEAIGDWITRIAQAVGDWISTVFGPPGVPLHLPNEQDRNAIEGVVSYDQAIVSGHLLHEGRLEESLRVRRMSKKEYQEFINSPEGQELVTEINNQRK